MKYSKCNTLREKWDFCLKDKLTKLEAVITIAYVEVMHFIITGRLN